MLDVLLIGALALLLVRGWYRGFVREAMDLVGLVLGTVLAFRLARPVGTVVEAMSGMSPDASRLTAWIVVFVAAGIGAAFAARAIERAARLPGLNLMNRVGGAGLAMAWGLFIATLMLSFAVILPMPPAVADQLDDSAMSRTLTDPEGFAQDVFSGLSGDRIVEALINLRHLVGERRVVVEDDDVVEFPPVDGGDLDIDPAAAIEVFDLLNRSRVDEGLDPLAWSPALSEVGLGHAVEMYTEGYFAHESQATGTVGDRLDTAGILFLVAGENLALAATPGDVHEGLMASPGHRRNILLASYRRVGIAVVSGPLGLMTVEVFTG
jgi:uncharacterized membrane protein required for colicin V production